MEALHRMGGDAGEVQGVGLAGVQPGLAAPAAVVVLTDEHRVGQQHLVVALTLGRRLGLEGDGGVQVALVVAVEVDLEDAADVGLVVGQVVEGGVVDLDRAVVPRRVRRRRRQLRDGHTSQHHCRQDDQPERLATPDIHTPAHLLYLWDPGLRTANGLDIADY
jgi:hypothetical protein